MNTLDILAMTDAADLNVLGPASGVFGVTLGLLIWANRVQWKRNEDLTNQISDLNKARIDDLKTVLPAQEAATRAIADSTTTVRDLATRVQDLTIQLEREVSARPGRGGSR